VENDLHGKKDDACPRARLSFHKDRYMERSLCHNYPRAARCALRIAKFHTIKPTIIVVTATRIAKPAVPSSSIPVNTAALVDAAPIFLVPIRRIKSRP